MTDEERQRQMDFILEQQAQFAINLQLLGEAQARTATAVADLTGQVALMARQQTHINEVVAVIADAQQHTDERINALIGAVERHTQDGHGGQG